MPKHPFSYEIIYSDRKTLAIQVTRDGQVKVRAPKNFPRTAIDRFVTEKQDWILKHLNNRPAIPETPRPALPPHERRRYMELARDILSRKVAYYASIMHVTYGRISIREQKTRWGSCSSSGNLNFNWRLILAPEEVLDYVVVHELAHRREMNHSEAFYAVVRSVLPGYKKQQQWLKENGSSLWIAL